MSFIDTNTGIYLNEKGWTLIELLFVLAILSIVISGSFELFRWTYKNWQEFYNDSLTRQDAVRSIDWIKKNLREAIPLSDQPAIIYASENTLIFYSNTDADDEPEKVELILSGSNFLRKVYQPDGSTPPYTYTGSPATTTLTTFCRNNNQNPIFSYFASPSENLSSLPLSESERRKVRIVKINLRMDLDLNNPPSMQEFTSEVSLRNVK